MTVSTTVAIAALQMCSSDDVASNLQQATQLLEQAAAANVKLAVLPENFAFMGKAHTSKLAVAEADGQGPIQDMLAHTAQRLNMWLIAGAVPLMGPKKQKVYPACLVYNAQGQRVARYDKIHLFDVAIPDSQEGYRESDGFIAGSPNPQVVTTPWGGVGLSICYDLRFPELYRRLVDDGADIVIAPSAFTQTTGHAHWHLLTRTRALENQVTLIAPNQVGTHANRRQTYGHSLIANAWGEVQAEALSGQPEAVIAEFNPARQAQLRQDFPVLNHRRIHS